MEDLLKRRKQRYENDEGYLEDNTPIDLLVRKEPDGEDRRYLSSAVPYLAYLRKNDRCQSHGCRAHVNGVKVGANAK